MPLTESQIISLVKKSGLLLLDESTIAKAENYAASTKSPSLLASLVESGVITEDQISTVIADYYKVPVISLSKVSIPESVAHIIPEKVARKQKAIVFAKDGSGAVPDRKRL